MSTGLPASPTATSSQREVIVYSHSALFYWWPVWATGFIMAILTYVDGHYMAIVPAKTVAKNDVMIDGAKREALLIPEGEHLPTNPETKELVQPVLHMARSKNYGVVFATIMLLIILITDVPLRGLWSVVLILFVFLLSVILALADQWEKILEKLGMIQIHINAGGYVFFSVILFALWVFTVYFFDRRHYLIVTPGQVRVCLAIGAGETAYDTMGMTFQKRRDDLFRHLIVGMGSGDLIVTTAKGIEIDLPNVLFVGSKVQEIEQLLKEREVV